MHHGFESANIDRVRANRYEYDNIMGIWIVPVPSIPITTRRYVSISADIANHDCIKKKDYDRQNTERTNKKKVKITTLGPSYDDFEGDCVGG